MTLGRMLFALAAAGVAAGAAEQPPEVIVLDPNHPLIQAPGTARPGGTLRPAEAPSVTDETVPLQPPGVNAREIVSGLWFRYRALSQAGQVGEAEGQVATALAFMKRQGLGASPEISAALLAEGRRDLQAGDYRRAKDHDLLAVRFTPLSPGAHFAIASALLRGDRDPAAAARECWAGIKAGLGNPESLYNFAGDALLILFLGITAGATACLTILAVKNVPALAHDLQERRAGRLADPWARLLAFAILIMPIVMTFPLVGTLAFWVALLFPYFRGAEKVIAWTLLLCLLAGEPATRVLEWHFGTATDPGARALIQSVREGPDLRQEQALRQLMKDHPDEAIFPFLLASACRTAGRFDEAMDLYFRALEIDPASARAMVNLGNLHALRQQFAAALSLYRRAAETDPRLALAHYNSHVAHLEMFHLETAEAELKKARDLDDGLVTELLAEGGDGRGKRSLRDAVYTSREIWRRAMRLRLEGGAPRAPGEALTARSTLAGAGGLLGVLLWPGIGLASRRAGTRRCRRCGRAFCRRCQVTTRYPDVCSQCMHLFILRDGLAPGVKAKKMDDVARYRRRVFVGSRLLSLVLPGGGHVLTGLPLAGAVALIGWATAWIGMAVHRDFMVNPETLATGAVPGAFLPLGVLAFAAWLFGNLSSLDLNPD